MASVSKTVYIDDMFDKYNNKYHSKIKMKPINVNSIT